MADDGCALRDRPHRIATGLGIDIDGVDKMFGSSPSEFGALEPVNLSLQAGEFVSAVGPRRSQSH
jgi:hypothetical protein